MNFHARQNPRKPPSPQPANCGLRDKFWRTVRVFRDKAGLSLSTFFCYGDRIIEPENPWRNFSNVES
jgi:hypothetical protein